MINDPDKMYDDDETSHTFESLPSITLKRRMYTLVDFDDVYKPITVRKRLRDRLRSACNCSLNSILSGFLAFFPIVNAIRRYQIREYIIGDVISGLSAAFLHLPQGLGFGLLASLAPVYGLYTSFFPILLYSIFGTSHHTSFGTNAVIALLTANIVHKEGESYVASFSNSTEISDTELLNYKVGIAMAVSFLSGSILLAMGLLRLGFVTMYLSVSFIGGFTTASAVHISTSQISKVLRIKVQTFSGPGKLILTYLDIFRNIHETNSADLITAFITFVVLLRVKISFTEKYDLKMPVPIDLIVVVIGTIISHFAELNRRYGVAIVGDVPLGMPVPSVPTLEAMPRIASDSFVIAIIVFAMAIAMAKLMARFHDYELDDNQELVAYGMSNLMSSFFQCFPSTTAPPRTMVLGSLGARTTLNGIPSAIFILIVLLVAGKLFVSLPIALLAAMIVVAIKNLLLQVKQLPGLWHKSKPDFFIWITTFLVCVVVDLDYGIIAGLVVSMFTVIVHSQLASGSVGRLSEEEDVIVPGKADSDKRVLKHAPGIRVFYFNSMLFFANAEKFKKEIFEKVFNPSTKDMSLEMKNDSREDKAKNNNQNEANNEKLTDDNNMLFDDEEVSEKDSNPSTKDTSIEKTSDSTVTETKDINKNNTNNEKQMQDNGIDVCDEEICENAFNPSTNDTSLGITNISSEADSKNNNQNESNKEKLLHATDSTVLDDEPIHYIIIDCSAMTYIDITGINVLKQVTGKYKKAGTQVFLAGCRAYMWRTLNNADFFDAFSKEDVFFDVWDALQAAY